MSTELELHPEALPPFGRNGLMCYRRILPFTGDSNLPMLAWVAGDARGCVAFQAGPSPMRFAYSTVDIGGNPWMAYDVGRHTPRPVADYDTQYGPSAEPCFYLDNMPCFYDGSSLQAMELLKRAVAAGTEEAIWDELAEYFSAWIVREEG